MADVNDKIFLQGPKSTLWLEAFFQCPAHSNGRRLQSGDKNTVRASKEPLILLFLIVYSDSDIIHVNALGRSMVILNSYKVASDLLDQRSISYSSRWVGYRTFKFFSEAIHRISSLLRLDHTLPCSTNCKFFIFYRQYITDMIIDLDGALPLLYFPMAMSGVRVAECSQNTSILRIVVSINRAK